MDCTERLRKFEEEEQLKKLAAEQAAEAAEREKAAEKMERVDEALQLFDKPGQHRHWTRRQLSCAYK